MANTPPLKISDLSHPNSTNILNKWADSQGQALKDQSEQIKALQSQVDSLTKSSSTPTSSSTTKASSSTTTSETTDVTSSRAFGSTYTSGSSPIYVSGWGLTHGSGTGEIAGFVGKTSPTIQVFGNENTASVEGAKAFFGLIVPANYQYKITVTGDVYSLGSWTETTI